MLTAFCRALESSDEIIIKSDKKFIPELFADVINLETDKFAAEILLKKMHETLDTRSFRNCMYAFVSETNNAENIILAYLKLYFNKRKNISGFLSNPVVFALNELSSRVGKEIHRLKGLLRFQKINEKIFYAPFEPDHNIIYFLINHFMRRMADQEFIIHDIIRNIAVYYDSNYWDTISIKPDGIYTDTISNILTIEEEKYQKLWKIYFKSIAIKERSNAKLQLQFMPRRYWKYLTELAE